MHNLSAARLHRTPPWPTAMAELDHAEQLVIWSFRRWITGFRDNQGCHWALVWREFERQFGEADGREALSALASLVAGLRGHARRRISHHQPCCPCIGPDEVTLICLIAACQHRRPRLARSVAQWLVTADGSGEVIGCGVRLGRVLRNHSLTMPWRITAGKEALTDQAAGFRASPTIH